MNPRSMAGWIGFAGILMVLLGGLSFFQGADRALGGDHDVPTEAGFLVVDITAWGWIMLIWGIGLALVGLALSRSRVARWVSILLVSITCLGELGFLGNTNDTVRLLMTPTLKIIVRYALIVRWHDSQRELQTRRETHMPFLCGEANPAPSHRNRRPAKGAFASQRERGAQRAGWPRSAPEEAVISCLTSVLEWPIDWKMERALGHPVARQLVGQLRENSAAERQVAQVSSKCSEPSDGPTAHAEGRNTIGDLPAAVFT